MMAEEEKQSKEEKPKQWVELMKEFTQETTLHGIRYTTADTKFLTRR